MSVMYYYSVVTVSVYLILLTGLFGICLTILVGSFRQQILNLFINVLTLLIRTTHYIIGMQAQCPISVVSCAILTIFVIR